MTAPHVTELKRRKKERKAEDLPVFTKIATLNSAELRAMGDLTLFVESERFDELWVNIRGYNSAANAWNGGERQGDCLRSAYRWLSIIEVRINAAFDGIPVNDISDGTLEDSQKKLLDAVRQDVRLWQAEIRTSLGI